MVENVLTVPNFGPLEQYIHVLCKVGRETVKYNYYNMSIILVDNIIIILNQRLSSSSPRIKLSLYMAFSRLLLIDSVHIY